MTCILPLVASSQVNDTSVLSGRFSPFKQNTDSVNIARDKLVKPEIFTSGFIDIINSGQINASARFIRLYIGEPGKFAIPLSIYSGVSANNFQNHLNYSNQPTNEALIINFINPLSGLVNLSIDGIVYFREEEKKITKTGLLYQAGEKILTGYKTGPVTDPSTGSPVNFFNSFTSSGIYVQTGAWERNNAKNTGISWFAIRYLICYTNSRQLKRFIPAIQSNGVYNSYSLAWGVEINNVVSLKVLFYKYLKKPEVDYSLPIYQFSFNYSMR